MNRNLELPFAVTPAVETPYEAASAVDLIAKIQQTTSVTLADLAERLGTSLLAVSRWQRGDLQPTNADLERLRLEVDGLLLGKLSGNNEKNAFAGKGTRSGRTKAQTFEAGDVKFVDDGAALSIMSRITNKEFWKSSANISVSELIGEHLHAAKTVSEPMADGVSAGKNTYTYDAHTYHTKVPPQGIAAVIKRYLPEGGLILDPFSGSGMTGVAARVSGADVILNELSPAASFISSCFTDEISPERFETSVEALLNRTEGKRRQLYSTQCRECQKTVETAYTVWSYKVLCGCCDHEFVLWDECRSYGSNVKEHKILKEFACPACGKVLRKSSLKRTVAVPVMLGYKCCSKSIVEHDLSEADLKNVEHFEVLLMETARYYPKNGLPAGVNLNQPRKHGIDSIDKFYTPRNLLAMAELWHELNKADDPLVAKYLAFAFTSLYQRVTRMSEYRFWGGSGNTANFNVPYIFREANVFATYERKAKSIHDHLSTTGSLYDGRAVVRTGSATDLGFLPDGCIDFIFTDPPFGANINYSEMNILWESWLGRFTNTKNEAIVSKAQNKDLPAYEALMKQSLSECYRVLRHGHWMIVVFMISSADVWNAIRNSIVDSGFEIRRMDVFDKQHGTFKQFVSDNTAGCDLMLHCYKGEKQERQVKVASNSVDVSASVVRFLAERVRALPILPFIHVSRKQEIDYRLLYSEFLSSNMLSEYELVDFSYFRKAVDEFVRSSV